MKASIYAIDKEKDRGDNNWALPPGRETRVSPKDLKVSASSKTIDIYAKYEEQMSSGDRGGNPKIIVRRLFLSLDTEDIKRIVNEAVKAQLIPIPAQKKIDAAKVHLKRALEELDGRAD
jgi:hypothetical protein